ncbi:hypothetical protein HYW75_01705 [Candidatus Pacearchaeota archaeon]|nr:hypothetical protein [Candidatus Pacearchaeota archaeon]
MIVKNIKNVSKEGKNLLTSAFLATNIFGNTLNAQTFSGSIESAASSENITFDTILSLDLSNKINFFTRNRTTFDYQSGEGKPFTLVDLSYNWNNGLGILSETQFSNNGEVDQRLGLQYFKKIGHLSIYVEGTVSAFNGLNTEALAKLRYSQPIKEKLEGIIQVETITDLNTQRITFATQRYRTGIGVGKNFEFGVAVDMTEIPLKKKVNIEHTFGGYITYKF